LIEVMIVVAIISILAAVAYPSYLRYSARSHVTAAQTYLMDIAQREQQYLLDNRSYADKTTIAGLVSTPASTFTTDYTWDVTLDAAAQGPTPNFIVVATPVSGAFVDKYGGATYNQVVSITNAGIKSPSNIWQ